MDSRPLPPAALLCLALLAGACDIPRDPEGTLERVRGGTLRVGLTEAPPWVVRRGDAPSGVEPELIRRFADSLAATVEWHWGPAAEHMEALARFDLDVAAGGFTRGLPWRREVAFTAAYHQASVRVAPPPGSPPPAEDAIEGRPVAVHPAGPLAARVRDAGGRPVPRDALATAGGLVAAPVWELLAMGRDTTGPRLTTRRHVLAVPPGENGFLSALETALQGADVGALLRAAGGEGS